MGSGTVTSVLLVVLTALLLALAAITGYMRAEIVDSPIFAGRAAASLDDRQVRVALAGRVVNGVLDKVAPDTVVVRPLAVAAMTEVLDTSSFRRAFELTVRNRHAALLAGDERLVVTLVPDDRLLARLLRAVSRRASEALPIDLRVPVIALSASDIELRAARKLSGFAALLWPLLGAAIACAAACAYAAGSLRSALTRLAVAVAAAGLLTAALVAGLGAFVVDHAAHAADLDDDDERRAIEGLWSALFGDLKTAGLVTALGGTLSASLVAGRPLERLVAGGRAVVQRAASAPSPVARRARAATLAGLGLALLLAPGPALRAVTLAAGAALALVGLARLVDRDVSRPPEAEGEAAASDTSALRLGASVLVVIAALAAGLAIVLPSPDPAPAIDAPPGACNGSPALCDKRVDQVVFPATHNSYAAADEPGWFFANQRRGIARQLRDGIRAFLIDVHYGVPDGASGRIRTDLAYEGSSRNKVARELSPQALRSADRLAGRVGRGIPTAGRAAYLCHTLCELGAEPLDEQLAIFRSFLAANPGETLILFVEPYVPPAEIERAFEDAALVDYAATPATDEPLPTLRRLTETGKRLIVLAEEDAGAMPWYLDGFAFAQDTPLGADRPEELRCGRFRGEAGSPLLLVNHWIPPFPPSVSRNAGIGGEFLEDRLEQCERARERVPNIVAVDFYEQSGVIEIAARLNARP